MNSIAGIVFLLVTRCVEKCLATMSPYEQIKKDVTATTCLEKELMEDFSSSFRHVYRRRSSVVVG
jgi:hypothetical protein